MQLSPRVFETLLDITEALPSMVGPADLSIGERPWLSCKEEAIIAQSRFCSCFNALSMILTCRKHMKLASKTESVDWLLLFGPPIYESLRVSFCARPRTAWISAHLEQQA